MAATLGECLLADLDDLSDKEVLDVEKIQDDSYMVDLDSFSNLQKTQRYIDAMKKLDNALDQKNGSEWIPPIEDKDPEEYGLILDCSSLSVDIDNEILTIHNFIRDNYRFKFPELASLVQHPIDYARVVRTIGNETDLTLVDFEGLLPSAIIMVVSITASTTTGKPLPDHVLKRTMDACDRALDLDSTKKKLLDFVETRMGKIAPNLSAIVGSAVAAKTIGAAGGLSSLANMPACNIQLLGTKRKNLAGFSTAMSLIRVGYLEETDIFQSTPPPLRMLAGGLLATKSALAARVDSIRGDSGGKIGRDFREQILKRIEKSKQPPPARQAKPLPVPDSNPRKKRGGCCMRKMKERYAVTDARKMANRMMFGIPEESSLGDGFGEGYGMIGQAGSGKLRKSLDRNKLGAKAAKKLKLKSYGISTGASSGLTSSWAFTPVQGIELLNPQGVGNRLDSVRQSTYFT